MLVDLNYLFFHLSGIVEKAIKENDEKILNKAAEEIRRIQESIDTHYCIEQDKTT
jgi:adenylate kinase